MPKSASHRPTIRDVASEAGVSYGTVSRVLNGGRWSVTTQRRPSRPRSRRPATGSTPRPQSGHPANRLRRAAPHRDQRGRHRHRHLARRTRRAPFGIIRQRVGSTRQAALVVATTKNCSPVLRPVESLVGATRDLVDMMRTVSSTSADFELTIDDLRAVARFAAENALEVLPLFERAVPGDLRPRAAIEAAYLFVDGAARTNRQRVAATDAHRAAAQAPDPVSRLVAGSAGDAAAAAYLHPIAKATQVGHILRAAARAAEAAELEAGGQSGIAAAVLERARRRATPILIDVLRRYPPAPVGKSRTAQLVYSLDTGLRAQRPTSR